MKKSNAIRRDVPGRWMPNRGAIVGGQYIPNPQELFLGSRVKDVCYGGARGGGKSIALLLDFERYADEYGSAAKGIIFRKTYPELEELITKAKTFFVDQLGWSYVGSPAFTMTSPLGATLKFRHLMNIKDAAGYDGHEYPWQGFDEIGNWPDPSAVDRLMGSMRSGSKIPTFRRSTCMPGGPGHVWVRDRYRPDEPGVIRKYAPNPDRPDLEIEALFIPALLEDNSAVDQKDYEVNLAAVASGALFEAWRWGRWDVIAGAFFDVWDPDIHVKKSNLIVHAPWDVRWMSGDWGFRDDCVIHWHRMDENRKVTTYRELKVNKKTPVEVGQLIAKINREEQLGEQSAFYFSPDAWAQRTSARTIVDEIAGELDGSGVPFPAPADTDREGGWMLLYQMLKSNSWEVSSACPELVESMPLMQVDEKNSADVAESPKDHAPDSARYGLKSFLRSIRLPREEQIRRIVAEKVPELALAPEVRAALPLAEQESIVNRQAWASRRAERSVKSRFRPRKHRWSQAR